MCGLIDITLDCNFKLRSSRLYLCSDIVEESYVRGSLIELLRNIEIRPRYKKKVGVLRETHLCVIVRKKIRKRRLFKKAQAFCEEKVLRCLLGVFWYAESKNQCWQAEKCRLLCLICIFPRWPPN